MTRGDAPRHESALYGGPGVLRRRLRESGGVDAGRQMRAGLWMLRLALIRVRSSVEERLHAGTIRSTSLTPPPLFIVGHYRSGTTLLHKLIAADPQFESTDTFDLLFPTATAPGKRIIRPLLQSLLRVLGVRQSFFHAYPARLDDPNELEPLMLSLGSPWSAYWGYFCPRSAERHLHRSFQADARPDWRLAYDYFVRRAAWKARGGRLVVKDPMNTGRVRDLVEMFPGSKFVHIRRDPRRVVESTWRLWRDVIEPDFSLQRITEEQRSRIILNHYQTLISRYLDQWGAAPHGHRTEVQYERLRSDPMGTMERVYDDLDLPGFRQARDSMEQRLREEAGYTEAPREPSTPRLAALTRAVQEWCERLGYVC